MFVSSYHCGSVSGAKEAVIHLFTGDIDQFPGFVISRSGKEKR
jgi:hypothetical protein